ncbi:hypothetical protein ACLB2K_040981 [Fragaria x ananassa]
MTRHASAATPHSKSPTKCGLTRQSSNKHFFSPPVFGTSPPSPRDSRMGTWGLGTMRPAPVYRVKDPKNSTSLRPATSSRLGTKQTDGSLSSAAVREILRSKGQTVRGVPSPELPPPNAWLVWKLSSRATISQEVSLPLELGIMPLRRQSRKANSTNANESDEVKGLVYSIGNMLKSVLDRVQHPRTVKKKDFFDVGEIEFKGAKGPLDVYI